MVPGYRMPLGDLACSWLVLAPAHCFVQLQAVEIHYHPSSPTATTLSIADLASARRPPRRRAALACNPLLAKGRPGPAP